MRTHSRYSPILLALLALAGDAYAQSSASAAGTAQAAPAAPATASEAVFEQAELDQMLAPLALYPDALLAQVLMAATYPGNVADAAAWSMEHPDLSGDEAVRQVASEPWDPSVQSLVAFPAVLATLGQDPAWVQRVGDAFLAQPDAVMDSVQRLRRQAREAGNLQSNEQQTVSVQEVPAAPGDDSSSTQQTQTIIIEPADPQVVYVPSYNPSVVYGTWPYPSYPPVYYPPPPGYYLGSALAAGLAFGVGVAIIDSLWGDCDWGHHDIDIDVDRYNNLNVNRQLNAQQNKWQHNSLNRDGVPYRDRASRDKYQPRLQGAEQRDALRGHEPARAAERERARQALTQRGIQAPATSNREARERVQAIDREQARQSNAQLRQQARREQAAPRTRDNAFAGARSPGQARQQIDRGQASRAAASRPQAARASGQQVQRAPRARSAGASRRR